jgi:hypothetical protein
MSGTHSILAPSGASIWMQCALAPFMQAPFQDAPPTEESLEGDAAHWVAHMTATAYMHPEVIELGAPDVFFPAKGTKAPNGVEIDQDMIDGGELWADVIGAAPECGVVLEQRVAMPSVHPHMYGTPDGRKREARVSRWWDYKYGHRVVDPFECWQLIGYAASELEKPRTEWPDFFEFTIVQPRGYTPEGPVRRWHCTADQLVALVNQMHARAGEAVDESGVPRSNVPATTGPECLDCKGRHACTQLQRVAARVVDTSARADLFEPTAAQLGAELSYLDAALDRLKARRSGLAIQAEHQLNAGKRVPGYAMVPGRANLKWKPDATVDEVALMGATLGVALCRDVELVTPTQAKTILKRKGIDEQLLDAYSERPNGKMSLTQSTNEQARKAFGVASK